MADITLFELHLDDASFTSTGSVLGGTGDDDDEDEVVAAEESSGAGGKLFVLLALAAIVAVAWFVSRSDVAADLEIDEELEVTG